MMNKGELYAVTAGTYIGEMLCFIEKVEHSYHFLSMPDNFNRTFTVDNWNRGIGLNVIEFVEKLPKDVYGVVEEQFKHNKKNDNSNN